MTTTATTFQAIRLRNEKQLEEAVRETIRARGSQDIETAKAGDENTWRLEGKKRNNKNMGILYHMLLLRYFFAFLLILFSPFYFLTLF